MNLRVIPLVLCCIACAAPALADTCPQSCIFGVCYTAPQMTVCDYPPACGSTGSYDCVSGHASMSTCSGCPGPDGGGTASVTDLFTLVGPQSPSPVAFQASLAVHVEGYNGGGGVSSSASISDNHGQVLQASGSAPTFSCCGTNYCPADCPCGCTLANGYSLNQILSLPLLHAVGDTFQLTYAATTNDGSYRSTASASGSLSFPDLPPGYGIVSCQGFTTGVVTAAHLETWGRLKISYR